VHFNPYTVYLLERQEDLLKSWIAVMVVAIGSLVSASARDHPGHHAATGHPHSGPAHADLVLDNASVSVIRIRMAPHEKNTDA
jgi:hypothetical protein